MKKLLLLLVFISGFAFGQISQDSLQSIAKNYFEKEYVQQNYKDPYSYELKNINFSNTRTKMDILKSNIAVSKAMAEPPTPKKYRKKYELEMNQNIDLLNSLSEGEKNKIAEYIFNLDAYGANSYGNKVLGRYRIIVSPEGKILDIKKTN